MKDRIRTILNQLKKRNVRTIKQEISCAKVQIQQQIEKQRKNFLPELGITQEEFIRCKKLKQKLNQNSELISLTKLIQSILQNINDFQNSHLQFETKFVDKIIEQSIKLQKILPAQHKEHIFRKLLVKINEVIPKCRQEYERLLLQKDLPLKKRMTIQNTKQIQKEQIHHILLALHSQYSLKLLKHKFEFVLQQEKREESTYIRKFWQKTLKAVTYIFLSNHEKTHRVEQPQLLFQYMEQAFKLNQQFLADKFSSVKHQQVIGQTLRHFTAQSYQILFLPTIIKRASLDAPLLKDYFAYHFLQQVHLLQERLHASFNQKPAFIQALLLQHPSILQMNFRFEAERFQQKVFCQIYNINYSQIDLKNITAYNVVCNFAEVFRFFYNKFQSIHQLKIKKKIAQFYGNLITNLSNHIKTSFQRIFNYSQFAKGDIILTFKRVQTQFKSRLGSFLKQNKLSVIQKEYYGFLNQYIVIYALEVLSPIHKKIINSLTDLLPTFEASDPKNHQMQITKLNCIFAEWMQKIERIKSLCVYEDVKMRKYFFDFLKDVSFTPCGLKLYLKIFQNCLKIIFSLDGYMCLIHAFSLHQRDRVSYIQTHSLLRTNQEEMQIIAKIDIVLKNI